MSSSSQSGIFKSTQFWLKSISEINANFITSCNRNIEIREVLKSWKPALGLQNGTNKGRSVFFIQAAVRRV